MIDLTKHADPRERSISITAIDGGYLVTERHFKAVGPNHHPGDATYVLETIPEVRRAVGRYLKANGKLIQ